MTWKWISQTHKEKGGAYRSIMQYYYTNLGVVVLRFIIHLQVKPMLIFVRAKVGGVMQQVSLLSTIK